MRTLSLILVLALATPASAQFTGKEISTGKVKATGDTYSRTLADVVARTLGDVINVKDKKYAGGAKGDGTTDDTAAVQAAYNALSSGGGTITFPTGTYRFNLSITKGGVVLRGQGSGNVNTGTGATKFYPATLSSPLITIGDGTTANVRGIAIYDATLIGDGTNATGDGIRIVGASDVKFENVVVAGFGRDGVRMESTATQPTSGVYMSAMMVSANRRSGVRAEYGAGYVTNISVANSHLNGWNSATAQAVYLDSVKLWLANVYIDTGNVSGYGGITMVKSGSFNPQIFCANVQFDNGAGSSADTLNVSSWLAKGARITSAITGNYVFNGRVVFSDGTVQMDSSAGGRFFIPHLHLPYVLNGLYMPLDEADTGTQVNFGRTGTSGGHFETVTLGGSARFRAVFATNRVAVTYSASMTPDCTAGNQFDIVANNGTGFTINAPQYATGGQEITVRIGNTSGGALGTATWNAAFKMAAWTQPATGNSRAIIFRYDGSNWIEVARSASDIPN